MQQFKIGKKFVVYKNKSFIFVENIDIHYSVDTCFLYGRLWIAKGLINKQKIKLL